MGVLTSPGAIFPLRLTSPDGSSRPFVPVVCLGDLPPPDKTDLSHEELSAIFQHEQFGCDAELAKLRNWEAAAVPAFRTSAYWLSVRSTFVVVACATAVIWGLFYAVAWVAAGFRK
jgi:hypothetical protein